jgi:hypothetical protein
MPEATDLAPTRRRRWPLVLGVLVLLLGGAALGVRLLLDPERVGTYLLARAGAELGLELALREPPGLGLLPHLGIELYGLSARIPGEDAALFSANFVEIALPWSSLRAERIEVTSLRIDGARLDWEAFLRWQSRRAEIDAGPPAPLRLPPFDAPVRLRDASVVAADWRLSGIEAEATPLRPGEDFALAMNARLRRGDSEQPIALRVETRPANAPDGLALDPFTLSLAEPELRFAGSLVLAPPWRLGLSGGLDFADWPASIPALLADDGSDAGYRLALDLESDFDGRGLVRLDLQHGGERLAGSLRSGELLAWLADPAGRPLPPLQGELESRRIVLEGVELKGVRLRIDADTDASSDAGAE